MSTQDNQQRAQLALLSEQIKTWGRELGFQQLGITDANPGVHSGYLRDWLQKKLHGEMHYMAERESLRSNPAQLHPNTLRVISARMDYLPPDVETVKLLDHPSKAYISRYALGRDYHKLIRKRLKALSDNIIDYCQQQSIASDQPLSQRPFVDSAPVLERAFAEKAGLGWIGKNTMLINSRVGSWFFLGELLTNLPLPVDEAQQSKHCGSCAACLEICPTHAFNAAFELDARKCISYLTIELKGSIPEALRPLIGNRVFGCDDCQLICPWNKFAKTTSEKDFGPRHGLDNAELIELFLWTEQEFDSRTNGSPIKRIGYQRWLRNIAVGLGNSDRLAAGDTISALQSKLGISPLVDEHIHWAIEQLQQ